MVSFKLPYYHRRTFHFPKSSVPWLGIGLPWILSLPLLPMSLINAMNGVIVCKVNKWRRLSWLRMMTNRRIIPKMVRTEHPIVLACCRYSERKLAWDPLLIFCDWTFVWSQILLGRVCCVYLKWYFGSFILGLTGNREKSLGRPTHELT